MTFSARAMAIAVSLCASWLLAPDASGAESASAKPDASVLQNFITRRGDKLMDGDKEFRFIGANMPGLLVPYDFTMHP